MEKKYIKITNAMRQYMWSDSALCKATIETTQYRKGEIGLLHPGIIKFYENLRENIMNESKGKMGLFGMSQCSMSNPTSKKWYRGEQTPYYEHNKKNIPILMYEEPQINFQERRNKNHNYFIATLRLGEYETIENPEIDTRHFEAFDILMKGRTFDIPVEVAEFKIPNKSRKILENTLRSFREDDLRRARDQVAWSYPIGN